MNYGAAQGNYGGAQVACGRNAPTPVQAAAIWKEIEDLNISVHELELSFEMLRERLATVRKEACEGTGGASE